MRHTIESPDIPGRLILLLTLVAVEFGGYFLTRVVSGQEQLTDFQTGFARAGHAHAGVLIVLSLVCLLLADAVELRGAWAYVARLAVPVAAVLMSAGFFLSSMGEGLTEPNDWILVLWLGAASLTVGVVTLGIAMLRAGPSLSGSVTSEAGPREPSH